MRHIFGKHRTVSLHGVVLIVWLNKQFSSIVRQAFLNFEDCPQYNPHSDVIGSGREIDLVKILAKLIKAFPTNSSYAPSMFDRIWLRCSTVYGSPQGWIRRIGAYFLQWHYYGHDGLPLMYLVCFKEHRYRGSFNLHELHSIFSYENSFETRQRFLRSLGRVIYLIIMTWTLWM